MPVTDLQARAATDSAAAYELMIRYHLGAGGVDKNMPESLRWGEIAANAGHARAQAMIGWYYTAGHRRAIADKQKGLMWLEKAAAQNDAGGPFQSWLALSDR
jgi:TPR repeat protein